jgi:chromatin assembly factor 1 subunit B
MRAKYINIRWSSRETKEITPIFSLDFHQSGLLATGGGDGEIQLWKIKKLETDPIVEHFRKLGGSHLSVNINCVRFSPQGSYLASGADYGELNIWNLSVDLSANEFSTSKKIVISAQKDDILDLSWSNDSTAIAIASVDNTIMICDTTSGNRVASYNCHKNIVQGVSWDPCGVFLASQSADRSCHIFLSPLDKLSSKNSNEFTKEMVKSHILGKTKVTLLTSEFQTIKNENLSRHQATLKDFDCQVVLDSETIVIPKKIIGKVMFVDDNGPMFRRLSWSPDGSLLAIPSGVFLKDDISSGYRDLNTLLIYSRNDWSKPLGQFPVLDTPTSVTRWCPVYFRNKMKNKKQLLSNFPYRMYLAVASSDSVFIYDTERMECVVFIGGLHLACITDISWSSNGNLLAVSSRDGFCSLIKFEDGELGERILNTNHS